MPRESPEQEPPLVFVCYSRKDGEHVERLRTVLRPFENRKQLRLWYDLDMAPGTEADAKIQNVIQKADIALLVVSTDMLASAYIEQYELPSILAAGEKGQVEIVPLFLSASLAEDDRLTFTTDSSEEPFKLTRWQGLNQPKEPIVVEDKLDKARLNAAAKKLLDRATKAAVTRRRKLAPRPNPPSTQDRPEVTLLMTPEGDKLHRRFLGPYGELASFSSQCASLKRSAGAAWHPTELFEALFGSEQTCVELLKALFPQAKRLTPVWGGVRVRVAASDPRLLTQPWNATQWKSHRLVNARWSFEFARPTATIHTLNYPPLSIDLPCTVLVVAPEQQRLYSKTHAESVRAIAQRASPTLQQADVVTRWDQLSRGLRGRPSILHLHCAGEVRDGELRIRFESADGSPDLRTAAELGKALANQPPRIVILNALDGSDLDWARASADLAQHVPLLIAQHAHLHQAHAEGDDPRLAAQRILQHVLNDEAPEPIRGALEHGLASVQCWSHFGRFSRSPTASTQPRSPRIALDRMPQRDAAESQCNSLIASRDLRCLLLVSYGTSGNQLDHLGKWIENRLRQRKIGVWRIPVTLPRFGQVSEQSLDRALTGAFAASSGRPWATTLEQQLSKWFKPKTTGLVLLDFGACGGSSPDHGPPLSSAEVKAIAEYCRTRLAVHCPERVRLAGVLTLEVAADALPETKALLQDVRNLRIPDDETGSHSVYRFWPLAQIEQVDRADIIDYLTASENHSGCNPKLADAWATALYKRTAGHFEQTVALIESAQEVGWSPSFLESLQRPAAPPAANQSDAPAP